MKDLSNIESHVRQWPVGSEDDGHGNFVPPTDLPSLIGHALNDLVLLAQQNGLCVWSESKGPLHPDLQLVDGEYNRVG